MWISKGFVQPQDDSSSQDDRLEEEAIKYYQELINRNLIEPTEGAVVYQCTMHDMVRTFAEFMAREDSLETGKLQQHVVVVVMITLSVACL